MSRMEKLIISVATTGSTTSKQDNPNLPITPAEIADEVYHCWQAGASIAHIHVRDKAGERSMDIDLFKETVKLIKEKCNIIINLTTSGSGEITEEQRLRPVELKPEIASFDAGSLNFGPRVFINSPQFLEKLALKMKQYNVKPEIEVFDAGMVSNALRLFKKGYLELPLHFQFVLGVKGGMEATARNLIFLHDSIPPESTWSVVGIGKGQLPMSLISMTIGGHVRVGMEDNIYLHKGVLAQSNAQFVERMVKLAREIGREIATPDESRKILKLTTP